MAASGALMPSSAPPRQNNRMLFPERLFSPLRETITGLDALVDATSASLGDVELRSVCYAAELGKNPFLQAGNYTAIASK
jgi:hypothetical protein